MAAARLLHEFHQHTAGSLGMQEDDGHAVGAPCAARQSPSTTAPLAFNGVAGGQDVGDLKADVVLTALGGLGQKGVDGRGFPIGLDQLDLSVGQVDKS